MDLFDLFAKISIDTSEWEQGVDAASNSGRGLAQQLGTEIVSATSRAESSMDRLGACAGQTGNDFGGAGDDANDLGDDLRDAGDNARRAGDDLDDLGEGAEDAGENAEKSSGLWNKLKDAFADASVEAETNKNKIKVLSAQYESAKKEVSELTDEFNGCVNKMGAQSKEAQDLARKLEEAEAEANRLKQEINGTGYSFDSFSMETIALGTALGNLATGAIQLVIGKFKEMVSAVWNIDDTTREYREGMGKLETAFQMAGYGSDVAKSAFRSMYHILGDNDTATEASQLLAQLAENEQQISDWGTIAAGVLGTFGDSLPVEGLIEASNETAKVGTVTGVLADALNWVGISEDEFNGKLEACADTSERTALITDTLRGQYSSAAAALEENNAEVLAYNDSQLAMQDSMANLGETVGKVKSAFMDKLAPAIGKVADKLAEWIGKIDVDAIFEKISTIVKNFQFGWEMISTIWDAAVGFFEGIGDGIMTAFTGVGEFFSTIFQAANDAIVVIFTVLPDFFSGIWEGIKSVFAAVVEFFSELFSNAWVAIQTIWSVVVGFFTGIWDGITTVFSVVVTFFSDVFSSAWNTIRSIWSAVVGFFSGVWSGISSAFSSVKSFFSTTFSGALSSIKSAWSSVTSFFDGKWQSIKNVFSNAFSSFSSIGSNIVSGIKQGIANGWSALTGWVADKARSLLNAAKNALGIKSPSREFRDQVGKNMALGIGVGFEDAMPEVVKDINAAMDIGNYISTVDMPAYHGYISPSRAPAGSTAKAIDEIIVAINALNNKLDNIKIYLDTGVMVGEMSSGINRTLGKVYSKDRRLVLEDGLG